MALREAAWGAERGQAVNDVREAARFTQEELAERIGASKQTIYNIEKNLSGTNDLNRIEAIAAACSGEGWLPDDFAAVRRYILGDLTELPLRMKRRQVEPLTKIEGGKRTRRSRKSAATSADKPYFRHRALEQAV